MDLNGTQAAMRAGYSPASAASQACDLLKNPKVQEAIAEAQGARAERTEVTQDRVLLELARVAFSDPAKAYGADGRLLSVHEMPPEARAALAGMDVEEDVVGGEEGETPLRRVTRKLKSWDKVKALELLCKHLGMLKEKVEHSGADGQALSITIDMGGKR